MNNVPVDLNKPIEIAYICRVCKTIFYRSYHIKEILAKRLKKGILPDINNLTVAGMNLPKILYCNPDCRSNRHGK